jgi:3-hydroxybutyryl-CoA dehydrogenase
MTERSGTRSEGTNMRVGVVGAGVMGSGIAQVTATFGYQTVCVDNDPSALERAAELVVSGRYGLERGVERGRLTRLEADGALGRLVFADALEAVADCDLVIEAIPERFELKTRLFRRLDALLAPQAILASNTSGFPISAIAGATDRPDKVIGWHWASPPPVMRMAEIIRTPETADVTVETVVGVAAACRKRPVVVNDAPRSWGFVSNRLFSALRREADRVVAEGVATPEEVDIILMDCFNWPVGPFGLGRGATSGWN